MKIVKANAKAKFDETIEVAMNLGIDPRHADQAVRGMIELPNGTGKSVRVAVFARGPKAEEAKAAGADVVGAEDLAEKINAGEMNFERCIATPDMMGVVGRLGKVLGPRGLMPNPKLGTVTQDVTAAVKAAKAGSIEFRAEKAGIVHAGVGKASFSEEAITANVKALVTAINRAKPSRRQGHLHQEGVDQFDHGSGRQARPGHRAQLSADRRAKSFRVSSRVPIRWGAGGEGARGRKVFELHLSETAGASLFRGQSLMGQPASADGGKGIDAALFEVRARARTSGAGEPDREVSVRAYPLTEAAVCNAAGPIRIPRVGPNWRKP